MMHENERHVLCKGTIFQMIFANPVTKSADSVGTNERACCSLKFKQGGQNEKSNPNKGGITIAIYHFNIKVVTRSKGASAVAKAAYISGEKIKNVRDGTTHDYRKKKEIVHKEILLPSKAPPEFLKRSVLWNAAEAAEKRKNSQTAKHIDAALPVEISRAEQIDLVRKFCQQCFVTRGMCVDFAIHDKDDGNPHVHILLTTRRVDENGFSTKDRSWNNKSVLLEWRKLWADWCNHKLYAVSDERIDHRSYAAQGIDKLPQVHLGAAACAIEKKGYRTDKGSRNRRIALVNTDMEIQKLRDSLIRIKAERNSTITETIEGIVGCKLTDMIFVESEANSDFEQMKAAALKNGIPICVIDRKSGGQVMYVAKQDTQMLAAAMEQNQPITAPEQKQDNPMKRHRSR